MPIDTNKSIRAFIAIETPEKLKKKLQHLQEEMKQANPAGIKWVEAHNVHLTLKFLSTISETTMNKVIDVLEVVCSSFPPFPLGASTLGAFPNIRQPRVFWLGLNSNLTSLTTLQKAIDNQLVPLGFIPEARPFAPHLTLARLRDDVSLSFQRSFGDLIMKTRWQEEETWTVKKVTLMKSQLLPAGPIYSRLAEIELKESE